MGGTNLVFAVFYLGIFGALTWAKQAFAPEAIPWADAFASATAYTGMWLMARKKWRVGSGGLQQMRHLFRCTLSKDMSLPVFSLWSYWYWPLQD